MDYTEQEQLTHRQAIEHWYYRSQYLYLSGLIRRLFPNRDDFRLADFGCGIGLFLSMLEAEGLLRPEQMCGIDPAYNKPSPVRGGSTLIYPQFPEAEKFDLILLMHVLEHIENDSAALHQVAGDCKPGGYLFLTMPAFQWLWSEHDSVLRHFRRYSRSDAVKLIENEPSLELVCCHFYYASILPAVLGYRWLKKLRKSKFLTSDLRPTPWILNYLLLSILKIENRWARVNRVAGLSVSALCRKKLK